jgi:hypothetical protein
MWLLLLPSLARAQVAGTVVDSSTGEPVPGALVTMQATENRVIADASGRFTLDVPAGSVKVVAAARGWFDEGLAVTAPAEGLVLALDPVPEGTGQHTSAMDCMMCHAAQYDDWAQSPMAHAGDNTWVYDLYDGTGTASGANGWVYTRDSEHAAANPASECRSCHQPDAWLREPFTAMDADAPSEGVSCAMCHQMADLDEAKADWPGLWPGVVEMSGGSGASGAVQYGVLGDVDFQSGVMRAAYQPELVSSTCAACHQDANDPNDDGDFSDGVISEPTWREWAESPWADPESGTYASCADCHMPAMESGRVCSVLDLDRPPGQARSHDIRGTTAEYLENAVTLEASAAVDGGSVVLTVDLTNDLTGHAVPTGVTVRNVLLLVEAWDEATGEALQHTGSAVLDDLAGEGDPALGYWAGLPGKVYAKRNHDGAGEGPVFYTEAAGITYDTRLQPFETDSTTYTFAAPAGASVGWRARVVYRRSFRGIVDAKGWTEDGHGEPLEDLVAPDWGHLMAEAGGEIEVPAAVEDPGCGCASASPRGAWLIALLVPALRRGGRRGRASASAP